MNKLICRRVAFLLLLLSLLACASAKQELIYNTWKENLNAGEALITEGKIDEAIPLLERAYHSINNYRKKSYQDLANTTKILGSAFEEKREYKKSNDYYLEALHNLNLNNKKNDSVYLDILYSVGLNFRRIGEYDQSLVYLQKRLKILEQIESKPSENYANTLNNISIVYKRKENFIRALEYNKQSSAIIKELYGEKSPEYSKNLSSLGQIYWKLGKYGKAIPLQKHVISLYPESVKDTSYNYALAIYTMSLLNNGTNEYRKEIELLQEFKQIMGNTPKYHKYLINADNNLAVAYDNLGDYEKAITYIKKALNNTSEEDENYPIRLQNLAYYYTSLGEFDKAIGIYNKALDACINIFGTEHSRYAQLIDAIGQFYLRTGEFDEAKALFEEALSVIDGIEDFDESHSEYGFYMNNYARALFELDQHEEAIRLLIKNIHVSESDSIIDKERYYRKQHDLAKAYIQTSRYNKALTILNNYKEEYGLKLGTTHPDYGQFLKSLAKAYIGISEYGKAMPYIDSSNTVFISQIDKVFKFRSEKENKEFIKTIMPEFDEFQSMSIHDKEFGGQLIDMNLNNQLLLKNMLLSQSRQIIEKLADLKDTTVVNRVYEYKELKSLLNKNYSLKPSDRLINFDSLKNAINQKEGDLTKLYSNTFDNEGSLIKDWKVSKESLNENEIAIEFANFKLFKKNSFTDSIVYVAYVYKNQWNNPKIINLFEEDELLRLISNKTPKQLYATRGSKAKGVNDYGNIYDLVWKPLEPELKDVKTVYFSPSGILNQIPFAAMSLGNDERLIDKHNLIQLSTTSKISKLDYEISPNDILFFGGIEYDYTQQGQIKDSTSINLKELEAFKSSNTSKGNTSAWKYLPATLTEINNIKAQFEIRNKKNKVLMGVNATEEEFKKFDSRSPKIIHIATHGFFYENLKSKTVNNQILDKSSLYTYAQDPLLRSGLILSGGNYAWEHGVNPYEKEDGILTAMEISNLDLSNTDMVVLSACETGLGDIDGSEGVYGLQRAFKMAGVDVVVMSLWEVPDKETAEFMQLFYRNWLGGINVREAFNQTQRKMAAKYKKEPEKWAAFVLFE